MYHYVRDLRRSRYPRIKGLDLALFCEQLEFFSRHYQIISPAQLIGAVKTGERLPPRALLLTFDDGYVDHFTNVYPLLVNRGLSACFFPVAGAVTGHKVLDVNKIHFIIAATDRASELVEHLMSAVESNRSGLDLDDPRLYWERCVADSRYDTPEVTFVKRMLQRELPEEFRKELVDELFRSRVTHDEAAFAAELYASREQLRCMAQHGMCIGSHGAGHYWMNRLTAREQEREIDASLGFLASLGIPAKDWIMCYPYGGYDDNLRALVRQRGCAAALAVTAGIADLEKDDPMALPRLDTNDLPKQRDAPAGEWTITA
jgi:peptidoglycan/xylan/chitin deacetylase (PgdA/CDA1 family)